MDPASDPDAQSSIKVHLFTENRLLRELMARLLTRRVGICVVGISDRLEEALEQLAASGCGIVLTDCLTTERGETLLRELSARVPQVRVILFGMPGDPDLFLKSAYLGVGGYVLKDVSASEMIDAVRGVARGEAVCPPKLCISLIQHVAQQFRAWPKGIGDEGGNKPALTHRQLELVGLVARGLTNKEIAASLNLSESTVKNHMRRILKQIGADDRHEAVDVVRATGYFPVS
jgi:DNA-binding NarL/FixJ family response regulator